MSSPSPSPFHALDAILQKRDGRELTQNQIHHLIQAVVRSGEAKLTGPDPASLPKTPRLLPF